MVSKKIRYLFDDNKIVLGGKKVDDWNTCIFSIVPSYIHMMNNRLGITIQEESYLAYLISKGMIVEITEK